MDFSTVDAYLNKLSFAEAYAVLADSDREKAVFSAIELLKDEFDESGLTDRAVALQVLYSVEGELEGYSRLKRQGIASYNNKGVAVTFTANEKISSDVYELLIDFLKPSKKPKKARFGRLI